LLAEVDPGFAVKYAEHAYQELRELAITPAEILGAWREHQRQGPRLPGRPCSTPPGTSGSSTGGTR
jgi:hypothetical protein